MHDGLTLVVTAGELAQVVTSSLTREAARQLIDMTNARGGYDSVSVVVAGSLALLLLVWWRRMLGSWIARLQGRAFQ